MAAASGVQTPGRAGLTVPFVLSLLVPVWVGWQPSAAAAELWPTTQFEVFVGYPNTLAITRGREEFFDALTGEREDNRPSPEAIAAVEEALHQAAEWFENNDFPAPALKPLLETDYGLAYRVYVCLPTDDAECNEDNGGAYIGDCSTDYRTEYLYLNQKHLFADQANQRNGVYLGEYGMQSAVHELVHAVVSNTKLGQSIRDCGRDTPAKWITEGIPDAISYDLIQSSHITVPYQRNASSAREIYRVGYRPYSAPLPQNDFMSAHGQTCPFLTTREVRSDEDEEQVTEKCIQKPGYKTSSFWRYLERAQDKPLTYAYLVKGARGKPGLLQRPIPPNRSMERDVRWVEQGLKGQFNRGLRQLYGLFIADLAIRLPQFESYVERLQATSAPHDRAAGRQNWEHWLDLLFGSCEKVTLSRSSPVQTVSLTLEELSAGCIWLEPINEPGRSEIIFMAESDNPDTLDAIGIGSAGSDQMVFGGGRIKETPKGSGRYVASWGWFQKNNGWESIYVITNVSRKPQDSLPRPLELKVTLSLAGNSALATVPYPPDPGPLPGQQASFEPRTQTLQQQRKETQDRLARMMEADGDTLSTNVDGAVEMTRRARAPACQEPFKYQACGPSITINLEPRPGTWAMPGSVSGAGGTGAQFFGGLQAMSRQLGTDVEGKIEGLEARLENMDGSHVGIQFPLIDYGFSGSFSNAAISVRMAGGEHLDAVGPLDETGQAPLVGRVTIEEYTPFNIRGSFEAPLAEFIPNGDRPPIHQPRETVTGYFNSVAPYRKDERAVLVQLDTVEDIAQDIGHSLGVSGDMMELLEDAGAFSGQGASGGSQGAVDTVPPECDCSCEAEPDATKFCRLVCDLEYEECS